MSFSIHSMEPQRLKEILEAAEARKDYTVIGQLNWAMHLRALGTLRDPHVPPIVRALLVETALQSAMECLDFTACPGEVRSATDITDYRAKVLNLLDLLDSDISDGVSALKKSLNDPN